MQSTQQVAQTLAQEHSEDEPRIEFIFSVPNSNEVRLIEVTSQVPCCGDILPFRFAPDPPDILFKYVVVLIHPEDWARRGELDWPPEMDPALHELDCLFESA